MDDAEHPDPAVLRSACEESRAVLDDQLSELSDIGDRALWTFRTAVIVLGVVASIASLGDARTFERLHVGLRAVAVGGVLSLLAACFYGFGTYFMADRVRGVGQSLRQRAHAGTVSEAEWRRTLLAGYDSWIAEMEHISDTYAGHLFRAQSALLAGVFALTLGAILSIWTL
jgi:Na+/H+-dicarboxylate symporter